MPATTTAIATTRRCIAGSTEPASAAGKSPNIAAIIRRFRMIGLAAVGPKRTCVWSAEPPTATRQIIGMSGSMIAASSYANRA